MSTSPSLLERCLHVLDKEISDNTPDQAKLIKDLDAAIAEQAEPQEPVGTVRQANGCTYVEWDHVPPEAGTVCYAAPPAPKETERLKIQIEALQSLRVPQAREPMSEDEIIKIRKAVGDDISKPFGSSIAFAHAIESHHGIK